jgi:predicted solute-binding protein
MVTVQDLIDMGHPWFEVMATPLRFARAAVESTQVVATTMNKVGVEVAEATYGATEEMTKAASQATEDFTKRATDAAHEVSEAFEESFKELVDIQKRMFESIYLTDPETAQKAIATATNEVTKLATSLRKKKA